MNKIILFYYPSLRSSLIYKNFIERNAAIIETVVEMPSIPFSRKRKKKNWALMFKALSAPPSFIVLGIMTVKVYPLLAKIFRTDLKSLCGKKNIPHRFYKMIDNDMLSWLKKQNPAWIISSTSTILTQDFIDCAKCGVLNLHEAPLPKYKGSACYYWMIANNETTAHVTAMYVSVGLDEGDLILNGPEIPIQGNSSVFDLWRDLLLSYKTVWPKLTPNFTNGIEAKRFPQEKNNFKATSYPDRSCVEKIKQSGHKTIQLKDIFWILRQAIRGVDS